MDSPGLNAEVRVWSADTEVADLQGCHIGLVPLVPHPWNEWKFFFKTIQYMAVGLPVVAANEGSNREIIQNGVNGFLVGSEDEWYERLARLCGDVELRQRMAEAARKTVVDRYSLQVQAPRVAATIQATLDSVGKRR
jgi:glycosyltransferase involved in cell wall biosynthesis